MPARAAAMIAIPDRLAPLPGCGSSEDGNPVVSLRSTTGYKL